MFEGEGVLMFGCTSLLLLFAPGYISLRHDVDVFSSVIVMYVSVYFVLST